MKSFLKSLKKFFAGFFILLLLGPALWAISKTLWSALRDVWSLEHWGIWPYAAGAAAYFLVARLAFVPMSLYVFGHELTHALSCILSGGRVYDFHSSSKGGHVKLSKTSSWIALSPYCIPLYTLCVLLVFRVLGVWWPLPAYQFLLPFLVGMSLAFHLALTVYALQCHQPDLEVLGWLPSMGVILFANCFCIVALLALLFPGALHPLMLAKSFGADFTGASFGMAHEALAFWQKARAA